MWDHSGDGQERRKDILDHLDTVSCDKLGYLHRDAFPLSEKAEERLGVLVRIADILGLDDISFLSYSSAISRLSSEELDLKRSLNRLNFAEKELAINLAAAKREKSLIEKWRNDIQDELSQKSVATFDRQKEVLMRKAKEYKKGLDILLTQMPGETSVTITELVAQKDRIHRKEKELKVKYAKVKAFQGLPPNLELARNELIQAQDEQMRLVQLRERLLGRMADAVS